MRIRGEMTAADKAVLGEALRLIGDKRTAEEFLEEITEASPEELRAWHRDARQQRYAYGLVLEAIETRDEA